MGRGCAKEACNYYPMLPFQLGKKLRRYGNKVFFFSEYKLYTFPVKHEWYESADLTLIQASVNDFLTFVMETPTVRYVMPRPGCGNGNRDWDREIKPLMLPLPNNVHVITFGD